MLFLPAAALCCLCSALTAMATQLLQEDLSLTRKKDESVSFSCGATDQCDGDYAYWYQKKESETFKIIFRYSKSTCEILKQYNHPQKDDFSSERNPMGCALKINTIKLDHKASYYCSCVKSEYLFGSGTKLFVGKKPVKKPEVTVCPVKTEAAEEGKTALMCLASSMFPPLVQISWKRQEQNSKQEKPIPAEEKEKKLSGSRSSASIRLVNDDALYDYEYICEVQHETGKVINQTQLQGLPAPTTRSPPSAAPPGPDPAAASVPPQLPVKLPVSFQSECRVKLLCLLYTVLIVKSLVYCCGLSLLMMLTNQGPSTT
ncbi:uncharacterized protein LOC118561431 [Fundulus heteroclitus]|uniref:uncharacterized protein LOC118561431 n=1 Tax=Fundulus heteroclitus TaxID=8078 RepID=UPI00165C11FF|nr:uncharacterized protein LOC118561431 [Fundulus heteroclitus]